VSLRTLHPPRRLRLERTTIERREVREFDVLIDIKFTGICHTDIHLVREGWGDGSEGLEVFRLALVAAVQASEMISYAAPVLFLFARVRSF
jgi:threonine dehydrogenase-like Zn-dependent dehydrogenase